MALAKEGIKQGHAEGSDAAQTHAAKIGNLRSDQATLYQTYETLTHHPGGRRRADSKKGHSAQGDMNWPRWPAITSHESMSTELGIRCIWKAGDLWCRNGLTRVQREILEAREEGIEAQRGEKPHKELVSILWTEPRKPQNYSNPSAIPVQTPSHIHCGTFHANHDETGNVPPAGLSSCA